MLLRPILLGLALTSFAVGADEPQRIEAEEVLVDRAAIPQNKQSSGWDIWSSDRPGAWSKDVVIRGGEVKTDRDPHDPESKLLKFRIPVVAGTYRVTVSGGRSFAISADGGKSFTRIDGGGVVVDQIEMQNGSLELQVANCFAARPPANPGPCYIDFFTVQRLSAQDILRYKYPQPNVSWRKTPGNEQTFPANSVVIDKDMLGKKLTRGKWEALNNGGLRSVGTTTDIVPASPEAARIKFRIPVERGAKYDLVVFGGRNFGISFDGKNFSKIVGSGFSGGEMIAEGISSDTGFLEFYAADCFATQPNTGTVYISSFKTIKIMSKSRSSQVNGFASKRIEEPLNRGVVAIPTPAGAYISWRLLRNDASDIGFDVIRQRGNKEVKLNVAPVVQTCDFVDPDARPGDLYRVNPVNDSRSVSGQCKLWDNPYRSIKLQDPNARVMRVGIGDLNGDGEYDYVFKTPDANIDPADGFWYPTPEPYKLEAHLADGTLLWSKSYGWAIERGVWYSPFIVYDFDGDGKAEVVLKMGEGDPRGKDGRVIDGAEYLVVLDGMTGKEIARTPWPSRDGFENYNLASRNQLTMAYLDGKTPCIVALRGTYGEMKAEAWQLKDGKLEALWQFDNYGMGKRYQGQGAHSTLVADFDGDGRDEILLGSMMLDDNGSVLWSTGLGHPDYIYYTDIMPEHPGPEIAFIYETPQSSNGVCIADPKTGRIIWGLKDPTYHVNDGFAVDFDPVFPGAEVTGIDFDARTPSADRRWRFTGSGRMLKQGAAVGGMIRGVYWDADLEKEVCTNQIKDFAGGPVGGEFAGSWVTTADLFGDWREEIISSLPGEVRIYTTGIPAMDRRVTLMQEHSYRTGVSNNSQGYKTDANLAYLPSLEAANFSMIVKAKDDKIYCQVTAAPSRYHFMRGEIRLNAPSGVKLTPERWHVNLKPGEISVTEVTISGNLKNGELLRGELTEDDGKCVLHARVPWYSNRKLILPAGAVKIPAAIISAQKGGQVQVVPGRPTADDGTVLGWDDIGHSLTWNLNAPSDGKYRLAVQCATPMGAKRSLTVNGQLAGTFGFAPTGGFGNESHEWLFYEFSHDGKPLVFELQKGMNQVIMENNDGNSLNLAYWFIIPMK